MRNLLSPQWRNHGVSLALFAMLALWVSPALAWVCCCHAPATKVETTCHMSGPGPHSCCQKMTKTAQVSAPDNCHCASAQSVVSVNFVATDSFSIAPLAVTVSTGEFRVGSTSRELPFSYTTWEARPRGPDPFTRGGRAPPVFSA